LRRLNEARVAASARLAHDLRSPLTCARAYQELLLIGAAGDVDADQAQMLEVALRNTDKVIDLVDELVSTAALEVQAIDATHRRTMPLGALLSSALETVGVVCLRRGQRLRHSDGHAEDLMVFVDPTQMERALVNVLTNAAKYTPEGGRISVTVEPDGEGVAIAVSDTGIGIPPQQIARLGEQFFRADTAHAEGIKGIGLGLAVTKAVLDKHGGRLTVTSTPGLGSTFTLWIPFRPVSSHETPVTGDVTESAQRDVTADASHLVAL